VIEVRAPAKLNLGLEVLRRREDGYHEIETCFVPLRLFDRLTLEPGPAGRGIALEVDGAELPTDRTNLVVRAAERGCAALAIPPDLSLRLEKRIPIAAGLGGGSSDAAATLLGLEALAKRALPRDARAKLALELGADVPFFLEPRPALGRGVGEKLESLDGVPEMHWVLVAFPFPVATAWAYGEAARELTLPRDPSSIAALLGPLGLLSSPRNDLEAASTRRHPEIREARRALETAGALATGMSGSGPTVFGRFEDERAAQSAAERVEVPAGARTIATSSPGSASGHWGWGVAKW
jgi:4-diphosphocytidyl-2-C-methyl-D-erythritol kinase